MLIWDVISKRGEGRWRSRSALLRWIIFGAALLLSTASLCDDDIGALQTKADAWIAKSKEVYRLDCDDMRQIWEAYCKQYDVTQERDRDTASRVADQMKSDAQPAIQSQLEEYSRLKSDVERLKTGETESQASKIL